MSGEFFCSEVQYEPDDKFALVYSVVTVSGLRSVQLIERGTIIEIWEIDEEAMTLDIGFSLLPKDDTWYGLVIERRQWKLAYTNPLWVMVTN